MPEVVEPCLDPCPPGGLVEVVRHSIRSPGPQFAYFTGDIIRKNCQLMGDPHDLGLPVFSLGDHDQFVLPVNVGPGQGEGLSPAHA